MFNIFKERTFRMVWLIQKDEKKGYLGGTAHIFPYTFKRSLKRLIERTDTVLLEGPLDEGSMDSVRKYGTDEKGGYLFCDALEHGTLERINSIFEKEKPESVSSLMDYMGTFIDKKEKRIHPAIEGLKPWMAFFTIWTQYLKSKGWKYSVDMEVYETARSLNKEVHFIETIEEQIEALEGIPVERIVNFLKRFDMWDTYARKHVKHYLAGDYDGLRGIITEYPTRCESIIDRRDPVMFERIKPYIEKGGTIAFVGTSHILGLKERFEAEGFKITKLEGC